jgi:hypothetical protein
MYDLSTGASGFVRWKIQTTGVNISQQLAGARNRGRAEWVAKHGRDEASWPLAHPPAVLWIPDMAYAACLRCSWLDHSVHKVRDAAASARQHSALHIDPDDTVALRYLAKQLKVWRRDGPWDSPGPKIAR